VSGPPVVLFMCSELRTGGAERQWALLLPRLRALGLAPEVLTLTGRGRFFDELGAAGVPTRSVGMRNRFDVGGIVRAIVLARRIRPCLIVTHEVNALVVGRLIARTLRIRHVMVEHAPAALPIARYRRLLMHLAARGADYAIAVSHSQVSSLRKLGFQNGTIRVIHNGVSPLEPTESRETVRASLGFGPDDFVALLVAALRPQKRVPAFIDGVASAHRDNPSIRGVVAGGGEDLQRFRMYASAASEAVMLLGERADIGDLMHSSDVVCLTSSSEANPVTLLEAMSLGRPVLVSDVAGVREIVEEGETGLLFPMHDLDGFASQLKSLAENPGSASAMGEAGREQYDLRFRVERMVEEYAAVFHSLLSAESSFERESDPSTSSS
jgi:glycosyltransferase involved in cell wall biosynthesis